MDEARMAEIRSLLQAAVDSPKGTAVTFKTRAQTEHTRRLIYAARTADREASKGMHPPDSPLWGVSPFDKLMVKMSGNKLKLIKLDSILDLDVEEL